MEINLINTKFKKFTNSVYVETILEHKIKSAVVEKFNIQPKLLIKLGSKVDGSFRITSRFEKNCIINNNIIDYILDIRTGKRYKVSYLYQYSFQTEDYFIKSVEEINEIEENNKEIFSITVSDNRKLIDINFYNISRDSYFEYVEYFYLIKDL